MKKKQNDAQQAGRRLRKAVDGPEIEKWYATMPTPELARQMGRVTRGTLCGPLSAQRCYLVDRMMPLSAQRCYLVDRMMPLRTQRYYLVDRTMPLSAQRCYLVDRTMPLRAQRCYFENSL